MDVNELQRLIMLQAKIDRLRVEAFEVAISVPDDVNAIEAAIHGALGAVRAVSQSAQQVASATSVTQPNTLQDRITICPVGSVPDGHGGCTTG